MYPRLVNNRILEEGLQLGKSIGQTIYPIFWMILPETLSLAETVNQKSKAIVETLSSGKIPQVAVTSYLRTLLTNEIFFTNEIEGVHTKFDEIETIVWDLGNSDKSKHRRLESTIRMYDSALNGEQKQINRLEDFREIYNEVIEGEIQADEYPDGKLFRNSFVYIGTSDSAVHLPPDNEADISTALTQLIAFMNDDSISSVIKAVVTHFMFENTHPFKDGNGRTGRYLLSSYLSKKLDQFSGLSISTTIHNNVQKYYKLFQDAGNLENRADLTMFINGILQIIIDGQDEVLRALNQRAERLERK